MNAETFARDRNVVVFEHLLVSGDISGGLTSLIANPQDDRLRSEVERKLEALVDERVRKYSRPELTLHIKLVYFFLTEGVQGMASGQTLADQQEEFIKRVFAKSLSLGGLPVFNVIGISELRPILAQVEAQYRGVRLSQFLLKKDGRGGYDTPKFAAALIQLARRDYQRQEMFIRVDEDVQPTAAGIKELKTAYYQLTHDPANKHFCISWNYENTPPGVGARPSDESYEGLFSKFVNSYSIRTTFLAEPAVRGHFEPETGRLFCDSPEE